MARSQRIVLDVGVGTNTSYPFRPKVTIDCTPVFMDIEKPPPELRGWSWVVGDAQYLPFRNSCFNGVIASHVLEHLENPQRFIWESWRVLKAGGYLELSLPNFLSINARRDPSHKHIFNALSLALMLKRQGFTVCFEHSAGSLLPKPLRKALIVIMNLLAEEIRLRGVKP